MLIFLVVRPTPHITAVDPKNFMAAVTLESFYLVWFGLGKMHGKSANNAVQYFFFEKFQTTDPNFCGHITGNVTIFPPYDR
jgi:deoxycytidine triphosphate deaminase